MILLFSLFSCTNNEKNIKIDFFDISKISSKSYYENGEIREIKCFTEDGMLVKYFWENGNIKWQRKYSKYTFGYYSTNGYSKGGKLLFSASVVNGKINGTVFKYYLNGAIAAETEIKDGIKHGFERAYSTNGKLRALVEYSNGTIIYCREEAEDSTILQEKFAMRYECLLDYVAKEELLVDINITFGGFEFTKDEVLFSHAFFNISNDTTLITKEIDIPIYSSDTSISYNVQNNERYMCLLAYFNKDHSIESLGCIYFDVVKDKINADYCEQGIKDFFIKIGQDEWETAAAYSELVGEEMPVAE